MESTTCLSFAYNTGTSACTLYTASCVASGSPVGTTTNYVRKWFTEAPLETAATCTHLTDLNEEHAKVTACKTHATRANCIAEGTNGICWVKLWEDSQCGGLHGTGTATTDGDGSSATA
jgi:hypothetical protein